MKVILILIIGFVTGVLVTDNDVKKRSRNYRNILNKFLPKEEQNDSSGTLFKKYLK